LSESDPQMLLTISSPLLGPHIQEVVNETVHRRLPAMFMLRNYVEHGGLMSYGGDFKSDFRRLAEYVARYSTARDRPICRLSRQPSLSSWSISRPPRQSASSCRPRFSCAPTRSPNEAPRVHHAA
jgi:hypothetical protein